MASLFDTTDPLNPDAFGGVGPNSDGTFTLPDTAIKTQPVDAGGGPSGSYTQQVLDIFKFGVGQYAQTQQNRDLLDYKRYEATRAGVFVQGRPAGYAVTSTGGMSNMLLIGLAVVAGLLLLKRG